MNSYWVKFAETRSMSVDAIDETAARKNVEGVGTVTSVKILPYPSTPRFNTLSQCPSFCHDPENCSGHTSCPKRYACSE